MFEEFENSGFILTEDNYYSKEANAEYMSVSQYKEFAGTYGRRGCEAQAMAVLRGEWEQETSTAMMVGSYVDAYFEGTLDRFKGEHPDMFKRDGGLKADFLKAEDMIARAKRDELFMKYMSGQKQVIMTADLFGCKWKIKMDSYLEGQAIVDLKCMSSLTEQKWVKDLGYLDFVQYWGYDVQGAIYQEVVYQNTGQRLPFFIAGISKEKEPNIEIINVTGDYLREALEAVERTMPLILSVKNGEQEPERCECCDFCRHTKVLRKPIGISELALTL